MKKLICFVVMLVVSSVFAGEWKHIVTDNIVNDICLSDDKICVATDGGVEVFWKDAAKRFDNGLPWQVYKRQGIGLPGNRVSMVTVSKWGIFASAGMDWFSMLPPGSDDWRDAYEGETTFFYDLAVRNDTIWAAMSVGLFFYDGSWHEQNINIPIHRMAVGDKKVWAINANTIIMINGTAWDSWKSDDPAMELGDPNNICTKGDTVVVTAEHGFYFKIGSADWQQVEWPTINVGYYTNSIRPIPVAISKGCFMFGAGGEVYAWNPEQPGAWVSIIQGGVHPGFSEVRCLTADDDKLYVGTDNKMWVCEGGDVIGQTFTQMSATGIRWAHSNNITHIAPDNNGRILVGTYEGGYSYDVSEDPWFNSSQENVKGPVLASFVDNKGAEWIWANTELTRNSEQMNVPVSATGLHYPFWLLEGPASSASNLWLLTSDPVHRLQVYAGEGTWGNKVDQPSGLAEENILSASSTGKRMYIGTEEAIYAYDFKGNWSYKKLHKANVRFVATGDITGGVWVADGGYSDDEYDVRYINLENPTFSSPASWPHKDVRPTGIYLDEDNVVWVSTFQGAYYLDREVSANWQAVPLAKLTDDVVRTIYVCKTVFGKQVWFGTAGGLSIWNMPNEGSTGIAPTKTKIVPSFRTVPSQRSFDLLGRSIVSDPRRMMNMSKGMRIVQNGQQSAVKRLNIAR